MRPFIGLLWLGLLSLGAAGIVPCTAADYRARLPEDEVVYFVLPDRFANGDSANDRGGLAGDRLATGFDPAHKGFYHGGDLAGLTARLDYIQGLGATAIWLGPIYKNKPVQGPPGQESAAYHGYWITDFTRVDPHFGTEAEFRKFVTAVHARGMKVYLDIITNHTADVIQYRECVGVACPYRARAEYPYSRRGGVNGAPINDGFAGDTVRTTANFAKFTRADYAYTPFVPDAEKDVKVPAWLNSPLYYHNRGNSDFAGESSTFGDFFGLDDLMTEHPRVVQGFIEIYAQWITKYRIDGYRIDTARHVNPEFWQAFVPAMLATARAAGIPNFHIFGEVAAETADVAQLARHTRVDKLPAVLDFGFAHALEDALARNGSAAGLQRLFADDGLYEGGAAAALRLPTFTGNHDMGRFGWLIERANPGIDHAQILQRVQLSNALLFLLRGVPVVYYGDEQGFVGHGVDQDSRQDMFASQVPTYNNQYLLGSSSTTARENFDVRHPLYEQVEGLATLRAAHPALRRGRQVLRDASDPRVFAAARVGSDGREILTVFNLSNAPVSVLVEADATARAYSTLAGACAAAPVAPGSMRFELPPFGYAACESAAPGMQKMSVDMPPNTHPLPETK
jgi:glycosidase